MNIHVLHNARIYTGASSHPWAHALAILDGKVIAHDEAALDWREAPGATTEDMEGALIIPGITDAHIHLMWYARGLQELDLRDLSRKETLASIAEKAKEVPPGTWITGRGWDQNIWTDTSFPTAAELDKVAPAHPVALNAKNGHALVANSQAMKEAGVDGATPDPVHGRNQRNDRGELTGVFFEDAIYLVGKAKPKPDFDTLVDLFAHAQENLLAQGITSVHDVDGNPSFAAVQELKRQGRLHLRIVKYVRLEALDAILGAGVRTGLGDDVLRFGGLKLFADGALGSRTAAMFAPYEEEPDNLGLLTLDPEQLQQIARRAAEGGIAMAIHAIGDRANHMVLDTFEAVRSINPYLRHRVEHVQLIDPEDQRRLAEMGLVASMQPTHAIHDIKMADQYWGARSQYAYAWRSLKNAGARLAFGSDAPIEVFDPFLGLYAAVTRRSESDGYPGPDGWYPEQRLSLSEALSAYTAGGPYAAGLEDRLGLLMPGYHADLVVLDRNIFEVPPDELLTTQVRRAMVGGIWR